MESEFIAKVSRTINASKDKIWDALVNPEIIKEYMFGTTVVSDWEVGSQIRWQGEWKGKTYEDKGVILQFEPGRILKYSHFSPLSGLEDRPENYHNVTIELLDQEDGIRVTLTQDNNATERAREYSEANWNIMLKGLKTFVEK